jgi:molybdenum-dependent DNA-binding transcriptional regulator ModE
MLEIFWFRSLFESRRTGTMAKSGRGKRAYFTQDRRETYLANLRRTGNHEAAAREAGISAAAARRFRQRTPDYQALCAEAGREAHARLAGAQGPEDGVLDPAFESIRRGADGRMKVQARGKRRWSKTREDRFFAVLPECGNIAASARAAGVSREAVWKRRRDWPAFARRMEDALDEAEVTLEFRVACLGTNWTEEAEGPERNETAETASASVPFDHEFALRFLKWREDKRRGRGRAIAALPPAGDVRARIMRKIEAIKRHRAREAKRAPPED